MAKKQVKIELMIEVVNDPVNERQENNFIMALADALEKKAMEMLKQGSKTSKKGRKKNG